MKLSTLRLSQSSKIILSTSIIILNHIDDHYNDRMLPDDEDSDNDDNDNDDDDDDDDNEDAK